MSEWRVEDSRMYLSIRVEIRQEGDGKPEEWYIVDLMINGKVAGHGSACNTGVLNKEGLCESTAISYAIFDFNRRYQKGLQRVYNEPKKADTAVQISTDVDWSKVLASKW